MLSASNFKTKLKNKGKQFRTKHPILAGIFGGIYYILLAALFLFIALDPNWLKGSLMNLFPFGIFFILFIVLPIFITVKKTPESPFRTVRILPLIYGIVLLVICFFILKYYERHPGSVSEALPFAQQDRLYVIECITQNIKVYSPPGIYVPSGSPMRNPSYDMCPAFEKGMPLWNRLPSGWQYSEAPLYIWEPTSSGNKSFIFELHNRAGVVIQCTEQKCLVK